MEAIIQQNTQEFVQYGLNGAWNVCILLFEAGAESDERLFGA